MPKKPPIKTGKPVKPKKPSPAVKEGKEKIPVPCSTLTEGRIKEIAREEIESYLEQRFKYVLL